MSASRYDFDIEQGSSFKISLIYRDSDKNIVDLTNWCARLTWKTNLNTTQIFTSENLDNSLYQFLIDGPNGKLTLQIPANTTNSFNFSSANYDLELQSPDEIYAGGGKYTIRILFGVVNLVKRYSQTSTRLDCNT